MFQNIDDKINYKNFYEKYLGPPKREAGEWLFLCPFHGDKHPSMHVEEKTGKYHCKACGAAGNAQIFLMNFLNIDKKEAWKMLLEEAGIEPKKKPVKAPTATIEEYARIKKLPLNFLTEKCGLKNTANGFLIPYYDVSGKLVRNKLRCHFLGKEYGTRFRWDGKGQIVPYGLWLLNKFRTTGYVILVEGESDSHCLWLNGIPAIGIPGADSFKTEFAKYFDGLKLYIHKERGTSGETFVKAVTSKLQEAGFNDENGVFVVSCDAVWGFDDPADLWSDNPIKEVFVERMQAVLKKAEPVEIKDETKLSVGRPCTEFGNAERFVDQYGSKFRYCSEWGKWLYWNGKQMCIDTTGEVQRAVKKTIRSIYTEAAACKDFEMQKNLAKHAIKSEKNSQVKAVIELAKSEETIAVSSDELDRDLWLFNVWNGTIDLRSGRLMPHSINNLITKISPVEFDETAQCPRWIEFLNQIFNNDQELIEYIQKAVGYSMTGDTREQCLFFFYGHGSNGKSTFVETIQALMGNYAKQVSNETLMVKKNEGVPNDIAMLKGSRMVATSETDEGKRLNESLIKQLTGGDMVSARFLHQEWFEFKPTFKIWILGNHKPNIRGDDNGIWRRIRLIPFNVIIPDELQDKALPEKLLAELPGILNWGIEGCLKWQKEGLKVPSIVAKATAEYRRDMDILGDFFEEVCVFRDDLIVAHADLYAEYREYVKSTGGYELSSKAFAMKLKERGFQKDTIGKSGAKAWRGLHIRSRGEHLKVYNGGSKEVAATSEPIF